MNRILHRNYIAYLKRIYRWPLLALVMIMPLVGWGQEIATPPNGDGYYYISNNGTEWYLKPATIFYNNNTDMPFLTTNKTGQVPGSLWIIKANGEYYHIIRAEDMKYVTINEAVMSGSNAHRKRMHLESRIRPDDDNDFMFITNGTQYNIKHKTMSSGNHKFWNPSGGNKDFDDGGESGYYGIIGIYNNGNDDGSKWTLTFVNKCVTPEINVSPEGIVTITSVTPDAIIYYTTDGTDPNISSHTQQYTNSFQISGTTTVKAIAVKSHFENSDICERTLLQTSRPVFDQTNCDNSLAILCADEDATIVYTTDGSNPTTSSTVYSRPFFPDSETTIQAAAYVEGISYMSRIASIRYTPHFTEAPVISIDDNTVTIECFGGNCAIYYTTDGSNPVVGNENQLYSAPFTLPEGGGSYTIKAIAKENNLDPSCITEEIYTAAIGISDLAGLVYIATHPGYSYKLTANIDATNFNADIVFTGSFNGNYYTISGLKRALFTKVNGGTVKNVILNGVSITASGNTGAICNEADGATKIYNCGIQGGSVSGGTNTGGLVGLIKSGSSVRVVNCYNFASISGSGTDSYAAGIVGKNEGTVASNKTVGNVRIALCMMYGNVTGATNISPVYGGNHVSNNKNFTEYNYWRYRSGLTYTTGKYNDQMAIDKDEYLTRFPFYRHILNTHRELAAFFLFGSASCNDVDDIPQRQIDEIGHWVLKDNPQYPVIEPWEKNTKKVLEAPTPTNILTELGNSGYLNVTVKIGNRVFENQSLPITDMDEAKHDYTWGKVVLPFANEFVVNEDYSKICTGWKITNVGGQTSFSIPNDEPYNFSDRSNPNKDIYDADANPYIFAQGGYYIVPSGVKNITIEANFANAYYLCDPSYDIGLDANYANATQLGGDKDSRYHGQPVATNLKSLLDDMPNAANPHVQAIVLVGNYHFNDGILGNYLKAFTLMSIDADNNQEPDYGFYAYNSADRPGAPPMRFDFLPIIPVGMAAHVNGSTGFPGVPIWKVRGWFEMTETCVFYTGQCEIDSGNFNEGNNGKGNNRWIVNSGYFVQIVRCKLTDCSKLSYIQMGGNVCVEEFYPGSHSDNNGKKTTLVPVNVTGGEIKECFMTGYNAASFAVGNDIRFWCAGGKIGKFLGAYMEAPTSGNVNMTAKIDHALIGRFFGGGTSAAAPITGNIKVTIDNSQVEFYCGGPEFGNMGSGKSVVTTADNTIFGEYYGAGYGGTSITYVRTGNNADVIITASETPYPLGFDNYKRLQIHNTYGIGVCYKFEYIYHSYKREAVARFYTGYAQFSLATTGNVSNTLTNCKIKKLPISSTQTTSGDFYGAGCQGKVAGTVTSTLTNCTIEGGAFGGGYKAENNETNVYTMDQPQYSKYMKEMALFTDFGTFPNPDVYEWKPGTVGSNQTNKELYTGMTAEQMAELGNVTGEITITLNGTTTVAENVFGGGNMSKSLNNTTVNLSGNVIVTGNVYGGGNEAPVSGNSQVNIQD